MSSEAVHIVLSMKVLDPAQLGEYFQVVTPLMADAGIELLSAGTETVTVLEGTWDHHRLVLMRAPSRIAWDEFYDSPEYVAARPLRQRSTESTLAVLDGVSFAL